MLYQSQTERHFCMFHLITNLITIVCEEVHDKMIISSQN